MPGPLHVYVVVPAPPLVAALNVRVSLTQSAVADGVIVADGCTASVTVALVSLAVLQPDPVYARVTLYEPVVVVAVVGVNTDGVGVLPVVALRPGPLHV